MILQVPAPPAPDFPAVIYNGPDPYAIVAIVALVVSSIILFPLVRALARRLEGRALNRSAQADLDQVHDRLAELEGLENRMLELENRVEFSERLLARQSGGVQQPVEGS